MPMRFYACMGVCCNSPLLGRKGVRKMSYSKEHKEHIEYTFAVSQPRAQSDKPLTLSIQYGMLCDKECFSIDLNGITAEIRAEVRVLYSTP